MCYISYYFIYSLMLFVQEHEKRCWSVDFNKLDTKLIASGSDDSKGTSLFYYSLFLLPISVTRLC